MGKRASRIKGSRQDSAARGRHLWEKTQQSKPKGWDDVLARRSQRQSKPVMMMSAADRMPFGIELDTSPSGVKRRLWSDA